MKIGLITFHNSYNCGSMLQTFALCHMIKQMGHEVKVIDFSSKGQKKLYSVFNRSISVKSAIKNIIMLLCWRRVKRNYESYECFKTSEFPLTRKSYERCEELSDTGYDIVVTGSDQVWNIIIEDGDDAYFLPWVHKAKKVAYAPSFGAKNIMVYASDPKRYAEYIKSFSYLSIRENNGAKWIKDLTGIDAPVIIDPTLLLGQEEYDAITSKLLKLPTDYIFYYSPSYQKDINKLVASVSRKYGLPVIAFNTKTFYTKGMFFTDMTLPELENPYTYLQLIKNATMVITTSFHGTVFSSIYKKTFWTIKNGGMFTTDDRVLTLMQNLDLEDRLIKIEFDGTFDYMKKKDYSRYDQLLKAEQEKANGYLRMSLSQSSIR